MLVNKKIVGEDVYCTHCEELIEVGIEWHGTFELPKGQRKVGGLILCRRCAQHLMRILLEDIVSYDNDVRISLQNVMYHGQKGQYSLIKEEALKFGRFKARGTIEKR